MPNISPVSIVSAEAFGTPVIVGVTRLHEGITSGEDFGKPVILGSAMGIPLYTVFIDGVNCNAYVKKPSIRRSLQIGQGSRGTCELVTLSYPNVGFRPAVDAEVVIFKGTNIFFGGTVESTEERWYVGTSGLNEVNVQCTHWGNLLDRRIVGKYYTLFMGGVPAITIGKIVNEFLAGTGITYDYQGTPLGPVLGEQMFNFITVTEALNQIAAKCNADYYVDNWKVLRMFPKSSGWGAAPYAPVDNDGNLDLLTVRRTRRARVNRQGVRNSQAPVALWTDTITAFDGQSSFETTYTQDVTPLIFLNSVQQTVAELSDTETSAMWYYIQGGVGVFYRGSLGAGAIVEVIYPGKLTQVYWAENAADIALHGRWEAVEEVKDVPDDIAMQEIAEGLLERASAELIEADLVSKQDGWEPGQVLTMNYVKPPCVGDLLIESVNSEEYVIQGQPAFRHSIKASNAQLNRSNRWDNFFVQMIQRDKQPIDRITYRIGFGVAETIEGITNPGLSVGVKPPIRVADKDGILRDVILYFKSVADGTLTTQRIVIDIYCNGVSIFLTGNDNKLVFRIGSTVAAVQFWFVSNPFPVAKGDVFTFEVLEADPLAKDGVIELVVLG